MMADDETVASDLPVVQQVHAKRLFLGLPIRATSTFSLRIIGRAVTLFSAVLLTRALGVHQYGIYAYAIAWTTLFTLPTTLGIDQLIVRYVATYRVDRSFALLKGLVQHSLLIVVGLSGIVAALLAAIALLGENQTYALTLLLALPLIPIQSLIEVLAATIQGLHHPEWSLAPYFVIAPMLVVVAVATLLVVGITLTPAVAVMATIASMAVALAVASAVTWRFIGPMIHRVPPMFLGGEWVRSLGPISLVAIVLNISPQIGLIMLGLAGSSTDVGSFQVVVKSGAVVTLFVVAINTSLAPRIARYHAHGDTPGIIQAAQQASRAGFAVATLIALGVIVFRDPVLALFGSGLSRSTGNALIIVAVAEVFNAAMGSVMVVLVMTGRAPTVARGMTIALVFDLLLCYLLIPSFGLVGAAVARSADVIVWNGLLAYAVWKTFGVSTTAFARTQT